MSIAEMIMTGKEVKDKSNRRKPCSSTTFSNINLIRALTWTVYKDTVRTAQ